MRTLVASLVAFLGVLAGLSGRTASAAPDFAALSKALDTTYGFDEDLEEQAKEDEMLSANNSRKANKKKPASFSILGNGFLGVYGVGVMDRLVELGVAKRNSQMFAASSGSQVAAGLCTGTSFNNMYALAKNVMLQCLSNPSTCLGSVDSYLTPQLQNTIPAPKRRKGYLNCKRLVISVSHSSGSCNLTSNPVDYGINGDVSFFSGFKTKPDLINVLRTSSYIPGFSGFDCYRNVRGIKGIDGGFVANSFCFNPRGCIKIYGFPPTLERPVDIYPGVRPGSLADWPFDGQTWPLTSFRPDLVYPNFDKIVAFARADAEYWVNTVWKGH